MCYNLNCEYGVAYSPFTVNWECNWLMRQVAEVMRAAWPPGTPLSFGRSSSGTDWRHGGYHRVRCQGKPQGYPWAFSMVLRHGWSPPGSLIRGFSRRVVDLKGMTFFSRRCITMSGTAEADFFLHKMQPLPTICLDVFFHYLN